MYFITKDTVREAFRALRAEGYTDPKFESVLEQLGGGSKTTLGKYYGPIKAEFEAMDISGSEPEINHTGGSMPLAQEQETVVQSTSPAPEQTEEEQYQAELAQLEAAVQKAEAAMDKTEQAIWIQAQRCAQIAQIDKVHGFRRASPAPPTETRQQRWMAIPKTEEQALTQLCDTRMSQLDTLERARRALGECRAVWQHARAREAFLATEKGQPLKRELDEIMDAYEVAKAANQGHMVRVLGIKADNVNHRIAMSMMGL